MRAGEDLTIEKVVFGGDGLARTDEGIVLVPWTAPGERVRVQYLKAKGKRRSFRRADLQEVVEPSSHRVQPRCPHYRHCGGCQYQHLSYKEELKIKTQQIREAFARIAKMPEAPVQPIVASSRDFGYRNRISVHIDERGRIGFHSVGGKVLVDIKRCPLAMPEVNAELEALRKKHRAAVQQGKSWEPGHASLRHPDLPPGGFAQANVFQLENLQQLVCAAIQPSEGQPKWQHLVEGYAGSGFLTGQLLDLAESLIGIELDERLNEEAANWMASLAEAEQARLRWVSGSVEWELATVLEPLEPNTTAVLLDPPRGGLPEGVTRMLSRFRPQRLVYVSCDPPALARDAARLAESYRLEVATPVDLFPRTAQIEVVALFQSL